MIGVYVTMTLEMYYALTRTLWVVGYVVALYLRWKYGMALSEKNREQFYGIFVIGWIPIFGEVTVVVLIGVAIVLALAFYEDAVDERVGAIEKKRRIDKLLAENPDKAGNLSLTDQE